jgi:uncharacterized protein (TIGR00661 family)
MKFLFIVQGEGRGHITQSISLSEMLISEGHEVVGILVGKSKRREVPQFFFQKVKSPISLFESPNFVVDAKNKKIQLWKTLFVNTFLIINFIKSLLLIHKKVKETKPDVIINFYDLLAGLYVFFYRPKARFMCIGHQFLLLHPEFIFPEGFKIDHKLMNLNTKASSLRAEKLLALSFRQMRDVPGKKLFVIPPLLRNELANLTPEKNNYILGYILNAGYAEDIEAWHRLHPDVELHFFWDKKDAPEELKVTPKLTFHKIDDVKFLQMMSKCGGFSSTAGFESVCEAMYLGKPIMMVPTYGHFEQACNAVDASIAGAGFKSDTFQLDKLVEFIPKYKDISGEFHKWADTSKERILSLLTS